MTDAVLLQRLESPVNSAAYWDHLYEPEHEHEHEPEDEPGARSDHEAVPVTIDLTFPARWWPAPDPSPRQPERVA